MFRLPGDSIRVLDPGAGAGALTAALVSTLVSRERPPAELRLTAVELDPALVPTLSDTLAACQEVACAHGVACSWELVEDDYILRTCARLEGGLFSEGELPLYDAIITNPPYRKINVGSVPRRALERIGMVATNLYAGFVALAVAQLAPAGEYVAITPRSWCNGTYFEPFRRWLLAHASLDSVHVYGRRDAAFSDDSVLTENVIYHGSRGPRRPVVTISESSGPLAPTSALRKVPYDFVVRPDDPHSYIHLTTEHAGHSSAMAVRALPCTLADIGVRVSTGRVVDFRARPWLCPDPLVDGYPLIYPGHFGQPRVEWPKLGGKKSNSLVANAPGDILVPSGHYCLVKRFSSKEERRRIVATVFDPAYVPGGHVGLENHLNYFHANGSPLDAELAYGLAAYLNTETVDVAFRQFSGHTQVNATDLRGLRYPDAATLRRAGAAVITGNPEEAARILREALAIVTVAA